MKISILAPLVLSLFLMIGAAPTLYSLTPAEAAEAVAGADLPEQVDQLAQECQNGESLTADQLQQVISRCETLTETVKQSTHPQKKLLVIRLGKTRNFCLYILQLKQRD